MKTFSAPSARHCPWLWTGLVLALCTLAARGGSAAPRLDVTMELGCATYVVEFARHLRRDGALILSPQFDTHLAVYLSQHVGIAASFASSAVIHPDSRPIEGLVLHMGPELFGRYAWRDSFFKSGVGSGFQHTTMLIWVYGSAYADAFLTFGQRMSPAGLFWSTSVRYRVSYLRSNIIQDVYNDPQAFPATGDSRPLPRADGDNLSSVALTTGVTLQF